MKYEISDHVQVMIDSLFVFKSIYLAGPQIFACVYIFDVIQKELTLRLAAGEITLTFRGEPSDLTICLVYF